ncbi:amidase [Pararobbsia alpina]|uniref:amidase n=1 Tax=Pararobbsia alpina TaxID=621374 RepID=UPI0039A57465
MRHSLSNSVGPAPSLGLRDALNALRNARTTSRDMTERALERAERARRQFNTFAAIDWDHALRAAAESDQRYAAGKPRLLEGVPIAVKDLIDTKGIETRYGSRAYVGHVPRSDADIVRLLVEKGAIVIGKSTTHEFAWGVTTSSTAFGDTLNPLDTHRIPGGSSGGAAAAIAAGVVAAGLGTDTGGSVRIPAALCGVVGYKPTSGLLSTRGIFPLAPTFDHPGLLGRRVDDVLLLAQACDIEVCESDAWLSSGLGVIDHVPPVPLSPEVAVAFELAVARLGAVFSTQRLDAVDHFAGVYGAFADIVLVEGSVEHLRRHTPSRISASYEQETQERLAAARDKTVRDYADAQLLRHDFVERLHSMLSTLDFLILPTCPCLAPLTGVDAVSSGAWTGSVRQALMNYTAPFNVAGFPAISIPIALPGATLTAGLQIVARPGDDGALLRVASEIERLLGDMRDAQKAVTVQRPA